jgi:phosphonate transport system ATP-binding protein
MTDLEVRNLRKTYPNGYVALKDVSFRLRQGEFVCIVGRSGAGKSTLMRCLNGSLPITAGSASVNEIELARLSGRQRRELQRHVGFIYQEFYLVGRLTSLQNVLTGRLSYVPTWQSILNYFPRRDREIALQSLERVNMLHKATQRADSLSGGEKQRVAIARAFSQEPTVLLCDEPVANLDPELAQEVLTDLHRVAKDLGVTTLVNIHNIVQARRFADRIIGIAQGEVVFDGRPQEFDLNAVARVYSYDRPGAGLARDLDPLELFEFNETDNSRAFTKDPVREMVEAGERDER